jgi:RecQ family ATP-dependent DNA helicase
MSSDSVLRYHGHVIGADDFRKALKKYWGHHDFRTHQLEICENILSKKDIFVTMATGSGKSLTFQLPSVMLRELGVRATTIVVSPLLSLMEDQVSSLLAIGVNACIVGSSSTQETERLARSGEFCLIYITPEKLVLWRSGLVELAKRAVVVCIAVDESHCVSEWGHDFRPEYRRLSEIRDMDGYESVAMIALTASATPFVQQDIIQSLKLQNPCIFKASLNRDNLKYCVVNRTSGNDLLRIIANFRREQLVHLEQQNSGNPSTTSFYPTLIYVLTKKECEEIADSIVKSAVLQHLGCVRVAYYHAGMSMEHRNAVQTAFSKDEIQIVVATIAFGLGMAFSS